MYLFTLANIHGMSNKYCVICWKFLKMKYTFIHPFTQQKNYLKFLWYQIYHRKCAVLGIIESTVNKIDTFLVYKEMMFWSINKQRQMNKIVVMHFKGNWERTRKCWGRNSKNISLVCKRWGWQWGGNQIILPELCVYPRFLFLGGKEEWWFCRILFHTYIG